MTDECAVYQPSADRMAAGHRRLRRRIDEVAGDGQTRRVTEWIYFIHPPRDDFAATMTSYEETVWAEHFQRLQSLLASGQLGQPRVEGVPAHGRCENQETNRLTTLIARHQRSLSTAGTRPSM